jgi:Zn-dependent oligopeptidase
LNVVRIQGRISTRFRQRKPIRRWTGEGENSHEKNEPVSQSPSRAWLPAQGAIDRILAVKGSRTIENTLGPHDEAIQQLSAARNFSNLMQQVHQDKVFRDHATALTTKVSSAQTGLSLNHDVFHALAGLDVSRSDPATRNYDGPGVNSTSSTD